MTSIELIQRLLQGGGSNEPSSDLKDNFDAAFWAVNAFIILLLVSVCSWIWCFNGLNRLIQMSATAQSADRAFQRRAQERIAQEEASRRLTPEQRKQKILQSFQRNQVKMVVEQSNIVVEEPSSRVKDDSISHDHETSSEFYRSWIARSTDNDDDLEQQNGLDSSSHTEKSMIHDEETLENHGYLVIRHSSLQNTRKVPNCCAICLMCYDTGDTVVWSSNPDCPHVFHEDCLLDWLVHASQHDSTPCPCCRQSFTDLVTFRRERTIRWAAGHTFDPSAVSLWG